MSATALTDAPPSPAPLTLGGRLLNIFICPSEVFDEVVAAPQCGTNWRVPTLLVCLMGIILRQAIVTQGEHGDAFGTLIRSGGLTAVQAQELLGVWPLISSIAICLSAFAGILWSAFVLWFIGRVFLRTKFAFEKALEVVGLASTILVLGAVITILLIAATGDLHARPALSLLGHVSHVKAHAILETIDFFQIWSTSVLAVGLSRLSGVSFKESAFWVFGYWVFARLALILLV